MIQFKMDPEIVYWRNRAKFFEEKFKELESMFGDRDFEHVTIRRSLILDSRIEGCSIQRATIMNSDITHTPSEFIHYVRYRSTYNS